MSTTAVSGATASGTAPTGSTASTGTQSQTVDKNMFLQLLVAQLQNQDPLNPADGTQFVTQLAQFQQLEDTMNLTDDVAGIQQTLNQLLPDGTGGTSGSQSS